MSLYNTTSNYTFLDCFTFTFTHFYRFLQCWLDIKACSLFSVMCLPVKSGKIINFSIVYSIYLLRTKSTKSGIIYLDLATFSFIDQLIKWRASGLNLRPPNFWYTTLLLSWTSCKQDGPVGVLPLIYERFSVWILLFFLVTNDMTFSFKNWLNEVICRWCHWVIQVGI